MELVGEDGEQRQDVLVEERLLLLLLLRRRRRRSGRRTQATEARYCLVELQRKMSCNLQCISLVRYSRDRRNTLQRFPTSKHILRSKRMISALKMSFSDKRWLLINNFTFYPVSTINLKGHPNYPHVRSIWTKRERAIDMTTETGTHCHCI